MATGRVEIKFEGRAPMSRADRDAVYRLLAARRNWQYVRHTLKLGRFRLIVGYDRTGPYPADLQDP